MRRTQRDSSPEAAEVPSVSGSAVPPLHVILALRARPYALPCLGPLANGSCCRSCPDSEATWLTVPPPSDRPKRVATLVSYLTFS